MKFLTVGSFYERMFAVSIGNVQTDEKRKVRKICRKQH